MIANGERRAATRCRHGDREFGIRHRPGTGRGGREPSRLVAKAGRFESTTQVHAPACVPLQSADGQNANPSLARFHGDESPVLKMLGMVDEDADDLLAHGGRKYVLGTDLKDARAASACQREQRTEVEIVREDDVAVLAGVSEDCFVGSACVADRRPVDCVDPVRREEHHPCRRKVDVDEDPHRLLREGKFDLLGAPSRVGKGSADVL